MFNPAIIAPTHGPKGGGYNPLTLAQLVAWWSIEDLALADGAQVASWTDRVQGWVATQATASARPLYYQNDGDGKPKVRPDAYDDQLVVHVASDWLDFFPGDKKELWVVCKHRTDVQYVNYNQWPAWIRSGSSAQVITGQMNYGDTRLYAYMPGQTPGTDASSTPQPVPWYDRWHVLRLAQHGHSYVIEVNGVPLDGVADGIAGALSSVPDFDVWIPRGGSGLEMRQIMFFNDEVAGEDLERLRAYMKQWIRTYNSPHPVWMDGDSITAGTGTGRDGMNWANFMWSDLGNGFAINNKAVSGQSIDDMNTDVAAQIDANFTAGAIIVVMEYYNQAITDAAATVYSKLRAYCEARRAVGFIVVVCTTFHREDWYAGVTQERCHDASELVRANWEEFADAMVDLDRDDIRATATGDHIHPNATGHRIIGDLVGDAIQNYFAGSKTTFTVNGVAYHNGDTVTLPKGTTGATVAATNGGTLTRLTGDTGLVSGNNTCTFMVTAENGDTYRKFSITLRVLSTPENTDLPTLDNESPAENDTITCDPGTWTPTPDSYTYQWYLDETDPIVGATASSYDVTEDDVGHTLSCRVVATKNGDPSDPVSTLPSDTVTGPPAPENTELPSLDNTAPHVNDTIYCDHGVWTPTPDSYSYQWYRDDTDPIGGETAISYLVTGDDEGHALSCRVVATLDGESSDPVSTLPSDIVNPA